MATSVSTRWAALRPSARSWLPRASNVTDLDALAAEPGVEERLMALLGLEPRDDANDLRTGLHPILIAERAARLLVVVSIEIDAVVDEPDRRPVAMLARDLVLDGIRDGDELIHLRGKRPQRLAVLRRTNPGRVDGRHNIRSMVA